MANFVALLVLFAALTDAYHRLSARTRAWSLSSLRAVETSQSGSESTAQMASSVIQGLLKAGQYTTENPTRLRYAAATTARFGYFLGQGVGISLSGIDQAAKENRSGLDFTSIVGALSDAILAESDVPDPSRESVEVEASVAAKEALDADEQRALFNKNFQAIANVLRADLANIEGGKYKFPYDLQLGSNSLLSRRQWNPAAVLGQAAAYISDRQKVFDRRDRKEGFEIREKFSSTKYPDYYLQNFHYQTDGWLSAKSARLYDYQVESLFLGTADAMRRQVLPFFTQWVKDSQAQGVEPRVLDVATGTGRFASFIMDNFRDLQVDVLDLSPFYLAEAKKVLGSYDSVKYVEAPAENVPADDDSYDAITCVYLFHELPSEVRKAVLKEWLRVLKPGGKVFFVDSAQAGEVPYDRVLEGFTIIAHEPYYMDYTQKEIGELFSEAGFEVDTTEVHWVSKLLVATKPCASIE
jgi:ubiquinone/menaquinone biosynthesis C-methylase UbiE